MRGEQSFAGGGHATLLRPDDGGIPDITVCNPAAHITAVVDSGI
jgi:hypothetical protein